MSDLPKQGYLRGLIFAAYGILGMAAVYLFCRFLLNPLIPFILAWVVAMLITPVINRVTDKTGLPRRLVSFVCILLVLLLIFGVLLFFSVCIVNELSDLSSDLMTDIGASVNQLLDKIDGLIDKLPFPEESDNRLAESLRGGINDFLANIATTLAARVPAMAFSVVSSLPGIILFTVALVMATFYWGNDVSRFHAGITDRLSKRGRHRLFAVKRLVMTTGVRYLRAYFVLLVITFFQLLIGFLLLRIPYAVTLSAVIAIIDILPVLGVGTVLLPWAGILFLQGNPYLGGGILLLFGIIFIARQIIEPKIIGDSVGLPPLITLMTMYVGYRLFSIGGLLLLPLAVIFAKNLWDSGIFYPSD